MDVPAAAALVDERLAAFRDAEDVPGVAYGLVKDGALVHASGAGTVEVGAGRTPGPDDVLRIASMTKSFTAATLLLLRDRGLLRLDDALADHLPWTSRLRSPEGGHPITLRDLLTMGAGFPTDDPWGDRHESLPVPDFDALVANGLSFARPPRTGFEYSNLGYALLGRVLTEVSGVDYRDLVAAELLGPLGMTSTTYDAQAVPGDRLVPGHAPVAAGLVVVPPTGPGAFSPMGGLHSTVRDLARWVAGFQDAWAPTGAAHPLDRWSRREMQEPARLIGTTVPEPGGPGRVVTTSYAMGLICDDDHELGRFVSHSGGYPGYGSHMRWHPATGWGVVALGNRTYAPCVRVATAVMDELVAAELADAPADPLAGVWPSTLAAMDVAERLVQEWDDDLADSVFAPNMDLDRPRAERAADAAAVRAAIGPFRRSARPPRSTSPAHVRWWLEGATGRATVEVLLSPDREPRVQSLRVVLGEAERLPLH
ncbi:MAG: serine hydrolase [Frankiales bacterium]|nr:serine hydrolase [Frankiales bacterium]